MGLTQAQKTLVIKARTPGGGALGVALDDAICSYLVATIVEDLGIEEFFPELPRSVAPFFGTRDLKELKIDGVNFLQIIDRLIQIRSDADTYFYCLATLHKARLKYERIVQSQAIPTIEQVGPRGLLQYGTLSPASLTGLLFWRKWMFDIDNRAGQETGYVFEPIIAHAIGGVPYGATRSPIKRGGTGQQGRQVDCIADKKAYEIKIRVTIAASGQGRWGEELEFPKDCRASGYTPVLVVLDPTPNIKLEELSRAFAAAGGESYIGKDAWDHLARAAGPTMARFLELYVHAPLQSLIEQAPTNLPDLTLHMDNNRIIVKIGEEYLIIDRSTANRIISEEIKLPDDIDE